MEQLPQIVLTGDRWNARARRGVAAQVPVGAAYSGSWAFARARAGAPVCPCIPTETLSNFITTVSTCQRPLQKAASSAFAIYRKGPRRWLLTQPSAILGRERQRPRALVISYIRCGSLADKRDWSVGPKESDFFAWPKNLASAIDLDKPTRLQLTTRGDGPCLTRPLDSGAAHSSGICTPRPAATTKSGKQML